jgi:hypothetical protein
MSFEFIFSFLHLLLFICLVNESFLEKIILQLLHLLFIFFGGSGGVSGVLVVFLVFWWCYGIYSCETIRIYMTNNP